jgi:hypothetical protein
MVSIILPRPGFQGSGFGQCPHFRRKNLVGVRHIRAVSQLAGQPARPGQPERPDSRAEPAKQGRPGQPAGPPGQPGQANRHFKFVKHDFAKQKSARRWCWRSWQKPTRGQYRRLDFCPSLGIAVLISPPLAKSHPANSKRPMRQRAHRDVSDGGANGAVLHLSHRAPIALRHRTLNPKPSSDPVCVCRIGQSQSPGLPSIVGQLRRAHAFLRPLCRTGGPRLSVMFPPAPRGKSQNPSQSLTLRSSPEPATCTARAGPFKHYA